MEIILLWTIWITAFTVAPPDLALLKEICQETHPDASLSVSMENVIWDNRRYPTAMLICARQEKVDDPWDA